MNPEFAHSISVLDSCRRALAEAQDLDEVTDLRNRAEAIRVWAKNAKQTLEVQNRAAELRLLAERKAGKMLSQMHLKGGDRKSNRHADRLKLSDLGISQNQSKRWQREAAVSDQQFAEYVKSSTLLGEEITAAGLLRVANGKKRQATPPGQEIALMKVSETPHVEKKIVPGNASSDCACTADDIQEGINHLKLLRQILSPYASGESESMSVGERRAVLYLLSELESSFEKASLLIAQPLKPDAH